MALLEALTSPSNVQRVLGFVAGATAAGACHLSTARLISSLSTQACEVYGYMRRLKPPASEDASIWSPSTRALAVLRWNASIDGLGRSICFELAKRGLWLNGVFSGERSVRLQLCCGTCLGLTWQVALAIDTSGVGCKLAATKNLSRTLSPAISDPSCFTKDLKPWLSLLLFADRSAQAAAAKTD
jgi:hypothetical protein